MGWCGKGGLGTGPCLSRLSQSCKPFLPEGARTDTRNPVWPSCLPCRRITGIHPVSSPHPHQPWPRSPCFLEGHGCRHVNVDRARWPSRYCWCQELGPGRQGKGWRMCLPLAVPGVESRARQPGFGRGPVRGVPAVPAACPHSTPPTMAPLFPVARQFGGGSSATHAPLNRGQINPLGDRTR